MENPSPSTRSLFPLALGAALGAALAAYGIARPSAAESALSPETLALVNGVEIRGADHERALAALALDRREGAAAGDAERVLQRLIDEELLIQRAFALGLQRRDPRSRSALVSAVVQSITLGAEAEEPDEQALRAHHQESAEYFRDPDLVRVEQLFFAVLPGADDAAVRERAVRARARLSAGTKPSELESDPPPLPLPSELVPASKLNELLGPTAARAALETAPGAVSKPARSGAGYHVLRLLERRPAPVRAFELVREQVRADFRRRQGELRLKQTIDALRADAKIVSTELPR
jgi:peptidylprolyl isomerase